MIRFALEIIVFVLIFIFIISMLAFNYYKKCPAGSMMVIFNNQADIYGSNIKVIKSGGAFVWPFGGSFVIFDLSPFPVHIDAEKLVDREGVSFSLKAKLLLTISSSESDIQNAIERISGLNKDQINQLALDLVSGHLRSFFAGISGDESKDREKITASMVNVLKEPLEDVGLTIMNVDVIEIKQV